MRVIISGGGTGGHIYPALAIIDEIKRQEPDSEFLYIGTKKGLEYDLVNRAGIPFQEIEIQGFRRRLTLENFQTVKKFMLAIKQARAKIKDFKPDVVIGTGGYVCAPVLYAAAKLNIPTFLHEQNIIPGLTNKFLASHVDTIGISLEGARSHFHKAKRVVLTGNPIASQVIAADAKQGYEFLGISEGTKVILIFGGSRGAMPINQRVIELFPFISGRSDEHYVLVPGASNLEQVEKILAESQLTLPDNLTIYPYLYNMPDVLKATRLLISRAGASTLAEITALGLASILIPSPYVTNNHQEKNARWLEQAQAAVVITEAELTADLLAEKIEHVLDQHGYYSENAARLGITDAASRIYQELKQLLNNR